jgi:hypothetical protein
MGRIKNGYLKAPPGFKAKHGWRGVEQRVGWSVKQEERQAVENNIVVPEGMLNAFLRMENHIGSKWDDRVLREMLSSALRWLSENPIMPTKEQCLEMTTTNRRATFGTDGWEWLKHGATEWQRRMFLAPEPELNPVAKRILDSMRGSTLSPADADAIIDGLKFVTPGWDAQKKT